MLHLTTERLLIRDHVPADLETHHALFSDTKVMRYLPELMTHDSEQSQLNLQQAIDQIGLADRKYYFFRIEDRLTKEHIGEIGYTVAKRTPLGKCVNMGYFIRDCFWGRGYTPEALKEVIRFAFSEDDVYRISTGCMKENAASERVMQKCGLIKEAEFKEYQLHEGRLKDRAEYRLLRWEWEALGD